MPQPPYVDPAAPFRVIYSWYNPALEGDWQLQLVWQVAANQYFLGSTSSTQLLPVTAQYAENWKLTHQGFTTLTITNEDAGVAGTGGNVD